MARRDRSTDVNRVVRWVLLTGVVASVSLIAVGLLLLLVTAAPHRDHVLPVGQALAEALHFRPTPWLDLGILVLMFTPIVRVVAALVVYVRERDWRFVLVSVIVLSILGLSMALGRGE
jgi:uncharacterized membrane protein